MAEKFLLRPGLHRFPRNVFGSASDLVHAEAPREQDSLMIACLEQGVAPDNVSFAEPGRFVVLQHLAASMPSRAEIEAHPDLSLVDVEKLFDKYDFRHVIVCGHLRCGVIRNWLDPMFEKNSDIGAFRGRFDCGTRRLVDTHYQPASAEERSTLMVCEHVLCQIENLLTHSFISRRALAGRLLLHGWVVDDDTARVYGYLPDESGFAPL